MSFWGDAPEEWNFIGFHSEFLEILEAVWEKCKTELTAYHLGHEDRITDVVVQKARKHPAVVNAPYQIIPQFKVYHDKRKDGAIDIVLTIGDDNLYLAYEAKCLNTPKSKAAEYVKDGMIDRFMTNKYSEKMDIAGMIGYVYDGDMDRAERNLSNAIFCKGSLLMMDPPVRAEWTDHKTTTHHQRNPIPIALSHLLLAVN